VVSEARRRALGRDGDLEGEALDELRARYYARDLRDWQLVVRRFVDERQI
jgi:hypothetical protein